MKTAMFTPLYAAIIALVFVVLSVRTLLLRRRLGVAIGDKAQPTLARAVRAHGNFAEYVPLALILMYFLEVVANSGPWVHVMGLALVTGRLSHAYGVSQVSENYRFRVFGMAMTFTVIVSASTRIIGSYFGW